MNAYYKYAENGFQVVTDTDEHDTPFFEILPLTDTVIAAITFPTCTPTYAGDDGIAGPTLKAGTTYKIWGDSITLTSGSVILYNR